ncbi:LPS export ABC transporter periplasmic protein LptC [Aliifodinibius salipaludis]|uniref:LPS export ABC transporter periplasmic protein LptC n=1 Tax=Fodinibius salipaludis TaxID=2032627 RepID=UPI001595EBE1|nr:LPS export ABC transporter periplasmic protein LptC [Aliifodinibius salipaludis]
MEQHNNLFFLVLCLLIIAGISSCGDLSQEESQQVNDALKDSLTSSTETWDMDMEIMEDGQKKVRIWGSYAATYANDDQKETRIKGPVTVHVFDSVGTVKTKVFSNRAVYKPEDTIFELFGDVQVETRDNRHLDSEYLEWNQSSNNISTPKFVIIKTPTDSIAGTGFEGDTDLVDYTIKEPKGRVTVD